MRRVRVSNTLRTFIISQRLIDWNTNFQQKQNSGTYTVPTVSCKCSSPANFWLSPKSIILGSADGDSSTNITFCSKQRTTNENQKRCTPNSKGFDSAAYLVFQVTVHDPFAVQVTDCLGETENDAGSSFFGVGVASVQIAAAAQLEDDKESVTVVKSF